MDENKRGRYSINKLPPSMDRLSYYSYRLGIRNVQAKLKFKKRYKLEMDSGGSFSFFDYNDDDCRSGGLDAIQKRIFRLWDEEF